MARKSYLGVDIGTSSIKIVELANQNGQPALVTYGFAEVETDLVRSNNPASTQKVAKVLEALVKKAKVSTNVCIAALPTFAVFNSIISLPRMSRKDLAAAVRWEAKKFIPLPLEEMILDWKVLAESEANVLGSGNPLLSQDLSSLFGKKKKELSPEEQAKELAKEQAKDTREQQRAMAKVAQSEKENIRLLLTAAPKQLVAKYLEIFKSVKLDLLSLETEAFALSRSLIGNDETPTMIVDIGSLSTDIVIIEKGVPILNRGLDIGGYNITKAIMNSLNVAFERAEQFKIDFGVMSTDGNRGIPKTITDSLAPIVHEIQYVYDLYLNQGTLKLEKLILAGGSAFLPNLPNYLQDLVKIPTVIGNPWDRIVYPLDLKPVLDGIAPQMASSIGLAMRDI
ncbi:MAG: pilus assembly protein PilM [Candidatus Komeilibacteria bacterium]